MRPSVVVLSNNFCSYKTESIISFYTLSSSKSSTSILAAEDICWSSCRRDVVWLYEIRLFALYIDIAMHKFPIAWMYFMQISFVLCSCSQHSAESLGPTFAQDKSRVYWLSDYAFLLLVFGPSLAVLTAPLLFSSPALLSPLGRGKGSLAIAMRASFPVLRLGRPDLVSFLYVAK